MKRTTASPSFTFVALAAIISIIPAETGLMLSLADTLVASFSLSTAGGGGGGAGCTGSIFGGGVFSVSAACFAITFL